MNVYHILGLYFAFSVGGFLFWYLLMAFLNKDQGNGGSE